MGVDSMTKVQVIFLLKFIKILELGSSKRSTETLKQPGTLVN